MAAGTWAYLDEGDERRADVRRLEDADRGLQTALTDARHENSELAGQIHRMSTRLQQARVNLTPLATRIRASVFTVTAAEDAGSSFVALEADAAPVDDDLPPYTVSDTDVESERCYVYVYEVKDNAGNLAQFLSSAVLVPEPPLSEARSRSSPSPLPGVPWHLT